MSTSFWVIFAMNADLQTRFFLGWVVSQVLVASEIVCVWHGLRSVEAGKQALYIYVYIYIHICVYIYMYMYIHIHIYLYIHIYIYTYINIYIYTYRNIHIYKYIHIYIYIHINTDINIYIYIYVYVLHVFTTVSIFLGHVHFIECKPWTFSHIRLRFIPFGRVNWLCSLDQAASTQTLQTLWRSSSWSCSEDSLDQGATRWCPCEVNHSVASEWSKFSMVFLGDMSIVNGIIPHL